MATCWISSYDELTSGPSSCVFFFWPTNYSELVAGPPDDDPLWGLCTWPIDYRGLIIGPVCPPEPPVMGTEISDEIVYDEVPLDWPETGEMHFRLYDPLYGSLDLSCDTGYIVRSYEFASPEMREVVYPNALNDGTLDVTAFTGARAVTLDMVLRNTPSADGTGTPTLSESRMRDQIMKYLSPTRRPTLYFSEHGDYGSLYTRTGREIQVRRVRKLALRGREGPHSVNRPQFNELSMSWVAPGGLIEHTERHERQIKFTEENLDAEYIIITQNNGTVPAHWRLEIDGDLESPQIELVTPVGRSQRLWLNYHIEEPNTVTVDSRTKTVMVGSKSVGYRYIDDRSEWFRIPVGESRIVLTHTSIERAGLPYAYWQSVPPAPGPDEHGVTKWTNEKTTTKDVSNDDFYLLDPTIFPNLLALKADPAQGDGLYTGKAFASGEYVLLGDTSQAWFDGVPRASASAPPTTGVWAAGHSPVSDPTNTWIWTPSIDDATGKPVRTEITFSYHEVFL